jgi:NAD(P)-dependent dehydrogenase (short-subunit alcohol dehydrogenase family)
MASNILITGANRGIGLELARQLAARGDRVVATCRNPDSAEALRGLDLRVERLDVTDEESIAAVAASVSHPIDVLLNNAGVGVRGAPLGEFDYGGFRRFYEVNTLGALRVTEAFLPQLRSSDRKVIVNMTSRMGSIADNTSGGSYEYRATKAALNMVTRSMSIDLAGDGFICMVLHPGWVRTDMGGASAPLSAADSAAGILRLIDGADHEFNGGFYDYSGQLLPW